MYLLTLDPRAGALVSRIMTVGATVEARLVGPHSLCQLIYRLLLVAIKPSQRRVCRTWHRVPRGCSGYCPDLIRWAMSIAGLSAYPHCGQMWPDLDDDAGRGAIRRPRDGWLK